MNAISDCCELENQVSCLPKFLREVSIATCSCPLIRAQVFVPFPKGRVQVKMAIGLIENCPIRKVEVDAAD
jgi:hypothetical protein